MPLKGRKCLSLSSQFERYASTVYCPYDPELTIAGTRLKFIVDVAADPTSLQYDHFKELGRFISVDLKEDKMKTEVRRRLYNDMDLIDNSGVNGLCKLFLYEHFVVRRLSGCSWCMTSICGSQKSSRKRLLFV